jgi:hypothetical protein
MGLVLTGAGTLTGTVTDVNVNITYNVDSAGVDSLIETICDRKEDIVECTLEELDTCNPNDIISKYTESIVQLISDSLDPCGSTTCEVSQPIREKIVELFDPCNCQEKKDLWTPVFDLIAQAVNPCNTDDSCEITVSITERLKNLFLDPCGLGPENCDIVGNFASAFSAGISYSIAFPCRPVLPEFVGNGGARICNTVIEPIQLSVQALVKEIYDNVGDAFGNPCKIDGSGGASADADQSCLVDNLKNGVREFNKKQGDKITLIVENALLNICGGGCVNLDDCSGCISTAPISNALRNFLSDLKYDILDSVAFPDGVSARIPCLGTYEFKPCDFLNNIIDKVSDEECADESLFSWFLKIIDRDPDEKPWGLFQRFFDMDGMTPDQRIDKSVIKWIEDPINKCKIGDIFLDWNYPEGGIREEFDCVNQHILYYTDKRTCEIMNRIFSNNSLFSADFETPKSGPFGYKTCVRKTVYNLIENETCMIFKALTNGLSGQPNFNDLLSAHMRKDWYSIFFMSQGATVDKCVGEFDDFIDAVFCRVARKIVDRAKSNSCPSGDNSDCIVEVARALYSLIIANFGVPGTFSVDGQCKQAKFLVDLKDNFVQNTAFCGAPTENDIKYIS